MADNEIQEAILDAELIQRINAPLSGYDRRRLPAWLETDLTTAVATARTLWSAFLFAAGDVAGARLKVKEARTKLAGLIRNAHAAIQALPDDLVIEADKMDALVSLGFEQGELGNLTDPTHLASLADQIVRENGALPAAVRVPTTITSRLGNWLAILNGNEAIADGGAREIITDDKDEARESLLRKIARVRLYIASTTDKGEGDPALALYGLPAQARSGRGAAAPAARGAGPGDVRRRCAAADHPGPAGARHVHRRLAAARGRGRGAGGDQHRHECERLRDEPAGAGGDLRAVGHGPEQPRRWIAEQQDQLHGHLRRKGQQAQRPGHFSMTMSL